MADHCVILVDAGYLLASGGTRVAGTSLRSAVKVDHAKLVGAIRALAEEDCGLNALRLYWYDASRDGLMDETHKRIAMLPGVKVRLGRISYNGDQKGVDLKLGLDLVGAARTRSATIAYLVSGDDDLAEAVEAAQELGMQVVVVGMENRDHRMGVLSVAEDLVLKADRLLCVPGDVSDAAFTRAKRAVPAPDQTPPPSVPTSPVHPTPTAPVPGPPKPGPPATMPVPVAARPPANGSSLVYSSSHHHLAAAEAAEVGGLLDIAHEVGSAVAESWYASTTQAELNLVIADRPVLPVEIDRVLLRDCARRIGEERTDLQSVRRALREAFWERLGLLH